MALERIDLPIRFCCSCNICLGAATDHVYIMVLIFRLLEGLQAQLTTLVEQLSMPLALLPASNLLLEAAPDVLQQQLQHIPGQLGSTMAAYVSVAMMTDVLLVEPIVMVTAAPGNPALYDSLTYLQFLLHKLPVSLGFFCFASEVLQRQLELIQRLPGTARQHVVVPAVCGHCSCWQLLCTAPSVLVPAIVLHQTAQQVFHCVLARTFRARSLWWVQSVAVPSFAARMIIIHHALCSHLGRCRGLQVHDNGICQNG